MVYDLRKALLNKIIDSDGIYQHKYTNNYNSIKSIVEMEMEERENKLPKYIFKKFEEITYLENNLSKELEGVPLILVEQYFLRNTSDLNRIVYIEYKNIELVDLQIKDLYIYLERFFSKIYSLAVVIADYYSLEIKLKSDKSNNNNMEII